MFSRRSLLITSALGVAAAQYGCAAPTGENRLTIANASGGLNLTMAELMRQERFLESFGVDVTEMAVGDGSKILGGVISG